MTRRLVLSYVALTVVVVVILAVPLGSIFAGRERDRLFRDIEHDATVVAALSEDALEQNATPSIGPTLRRYAREPGGRIVVVDASGRSVADSDAPARLGVDFTNRPEMRTALGGRPAEGQRHSNTLDADLLYVAVPVASSGVVHGAVRVSYPSATLDHRVRNLWSALAGLGVLVVLIAAAIGYGLAQLVTRPVGRLKAAAMRFAAGELDARADAASGAPELRDLAQVFNQSASRVQTSLAAQEAFVADASHQLRSPLAALRLRLENIESQVSSGASADVAAAQAETVRLSHIADALLALTRVPTETAVISAVDAAAVARDRVAAWLPLAEELDVALVGSLPDHLWVAGTDDAVAQILDNLIDNALGVAPGGTGVDVAGVDDGQAVRLHVRDHGPGLEPEQRERAFDRFWRGPNATPGGSGLGLAIVAQLARACGGSAALFERAGGGTDATVTLPRAASLPSANHP